MTASPFLDPPPAPRALRVPPVRGKVLVLAPHSDDEIIGPGGTLLLHRRLADPVHIVVLTDGVRGDATSELPAHHYRELREQESRRAAARLGAGIEFWGFPDGTRACEQDLGVLVPRLEQALLRERPAAVYAPHPEEAHGDHHVVAIALQRALAAIPSPPRAFGYEIWSACHRPGFVVDISDAMEEKVALVREYASQRQHTQIEHFFLGLNAWRAVYLPKGSRYGEAFVELAPCRDAR